MTGLPVRPVTVTDETRPYWEAAAAGRLLLPECRACDGLIWYPRNFCPTCLGTDVTWVQASGRGTVYSFTRVLRGGAFPEVAEYVLAYVELAEGPRVLTNIVDAADDWLRVGAAVTAVFDVAEDEGVLVRFRPAVTAGE